MSQVCPHFRVSELQDAPHPRQRPVIAITGAAAWCAHPATPVTETFARDAVGGHLALTCGGDARRCPIPAPMRALGRGAQPVQRLQATVPQGAAVPAR